MAKKWIQHADIEKGGLHRALHVPEGEKIPAAKVEAATHSSDPHIQKMANLAETFKGMHHKKVDAVKKKAKSYGA
jgi:hypothetical protein